MMNLVNVSTDDSGNYTCIVSNRYGTIERYFLLNVISGMFSFDVGFQNSYSSLSKKKLLITFL